MSDDGSSQESYKNFTEYWRAGQSVAFRIGLHLGEYWELTYGELQDCSDGYQARLKDVDCLNHLLGNYVMIGFNSPKKYPAKPYFLKAKANQPEVLTGKQREIAIKARHLARKMRKEST